MAISSRQRHLYYFASDVHLGLEVKDPVDRENRFVKWLSSIPREETAAVFLLGDIWDFWYEYRDVVPKGYIRVFAQILELIDSGVEVSFFPGNHDIWCYSYFESLGMKKRSQPYVVDLSGKTFCLGHGDGLGKGMRGYKLMNAIFKCRLLQVAFSSLHPWFAFRFGYGWSRHNRLSRGVEYVFKGENEPLYKYAVEMSQGRKIDCFVFGHYHVHVDTFLPTGARLMLLKDWMDASPYFFFDGSTGILGYCPNNDQ